MDALYVTGKIDNVDHGYVNGDGVRYTIFSAQLLPGTVFPGTKDDHPVFYIHPDRLFAKACDHAARHALDLHQTTDIFLDPNDPANGTPPGITAMRVCAIVPRTPVT